MPYNSSTGIFSDVAGATTATAGATIASAIWNSINNDYQSGFSALGPANLQYINGAQNNYYTTAVQTINFAASASDIATFSISSILPPNITTYRVESLRIGNAKGTLSTATVSLFTGAGATGVNVMSSTQTTVSTSLAGTVNSYQIMVPTSGSILMLNSAQLFLHVTTSVVGSNLANVSLFITPVY
jgi:hypothetical protein